MTIGQAPRNPDLRKRPRSPDGETDQPPRPVPHRSHLTPEVPQDEYHLGSHEQIVPMMGRDSLSSTGGFHNYGNVPASFGPTGFSFPLATPGGVDPIHVQPTTVDYPQMPTGAENEAFRNGFDVASEYTLPQDNLDSMWYTNPPALGNTELTY
ncbi:hypothetical protein V5O48_002574 [Marasmius crinis-equi]|uniref:Uncharacterized protein n=1 Tax=Marasmius crinis-equi TaxID=585013 RepID=A0ABR3FV93_9AGAR